MHFRKRPVLHQKRPLVKGVQYVCFAIGALLLISFLTLLLFPGTVLNTFAKPRIADAFQKAYPEYAIHIAEMDYSVLNNRLTLDAVTVRSADGTFSCTTGPFSVGGIAWFHSIWGRKLEPRDFAKAIVNVRNIKLVFTHSQYELRCGSLQISVPDSETVLRALTLHPQADDERFFAASKFRTTRFHLDVPYLKATGLSSFELLEGKKYHIRSIELKELFLDVLVNKDKPFIEEGVGPLMPNELLATMKSVLQVDRLSLENSRLNYGERFGVGAIPALITFDSIRVSAQGISNRSRSGADVVIHAQGVFMKAGTMKVDLSMPVQSPQFSYQYSGSLSAMNLSALNGFLETSEQMRVKAGELQDAAFDIDVVSGHATGSVHALYKGLSFAVIDKESGSEKGIFNRLTSFIANTFKFRGTNELNKSGLSKVGTVNRTRKRSDYFLEFTWFALRGGVGDIVGF